MNFNRMIEADSYVLSRALQVAGKEWNATALVITDGERILWKAQIHPEEFRDALTSNTVATRITEEVNHALSDWALPNHPEGLPAIFVDAGSGRITIGNLDATTLCSEDGFVN